MNPQSVMERTLFSSNNDANIRDESVYIALSVLWWLLLFVCLPARAGDRTGQSDAGLINALIICNAYVNTSSTNRHDCDVTKVPLACDDQKANAHILLGEEKRETINCYFLLSIYLTTVCVVLCGGNNGFDICD